MWRAVGALLVVVLAWGSDAFVRAPAYAEDGYAGEAGPQVPLPAIRYGLTKKRTVPAGRQSVTNSREPTRKPQKPATRTQTVAQQNKNRGASPAGISQSARDKHLCKALQACRNEFVRCKAKIKHPDQSEAWSIAKEECGAHYKTCVQKDFKSGEWLFTRWFYFKELDCG